jgi:photosystem II stability/assembly factor-like uncharacterized protein
MNVDRKVIFLFVFFLLLGTNKMISQWEQVDGPNGAWVNCIIVGGTNIFCGTHGGGIYRSSDNGISWISVNNGLTDYDVKCLAIKGTIIFAGTSNAGVFRSTDNGENWKAINYGLLGLSINVFAVSDNGTIYLGNEGSAPGNAVRIREFK